MPAADCAEHLDGLRTIGHSDALQVHLTAFATDPHQTVSGLEMDIH